MTPSVGHFLGLMWFEWRITRAYQRAAEALWKAMWVDLRRYCHQQATIEELSIRMQLARTTFRLRHWGP